ncbi:hypothetical protein DRJ48_00060 [Candidatus Woesearchaeota archaeon]|nr:MAG: hypothetical protein DRJ48_00060 [Candidatus Woesearchaeota archaeon]
MKPGFEKRLGGFGFLLWVLGVVIFQLTPNLVWLGWCLVVFALIVCYVSFREGSKRYPGKIYWLTLLGFVLSLLTLLLGLIRVFVSY